MCFVFIIAVCSFSYKSERKFATRRRREETLNFEKELCLVQSIKRVSGQFESDVSSSRIFNIFNNLDLFESFSVRRIDSFVLFRSILPFRSSYLLLRNEMKRYMFKRYQSLSKHIPMQLHWPTIFPIIHNIFLLLYRSFYINTLPEKAIGNKKLGESIRIELFQQKENNWLVGQSRKIRDPRMRGKKGIIDRQPR